MGERHDRLRQARIAAGFERASDAAERFGWNVNSYKSNENGNAPFSFKKAKEYAAKLGVRAEWLYDAAGSRTAIDDGMVPIIGLIGADTGGEIFFADGQESGDTAPRMPKTGPNSVALEVRGTSMRGVVDDGALVHFEMQHTPPTPDMIGHICIVETEDGRVLFKRLLRGSGPELYDLESIVGPTLSDVRLRWAAHYTAIIPPFQAAQTIRRAGERQVA